MANVAYAIRSTYHTSLDATPTELVFGRDMILPVAYIANWARIRNLNQAKINKNTCIENNRRIDYDYQPGYKCYLEEDTLQRKLNNPREGPFQITRVHVNGNVTIQKDENSEPERVNIRRISPFMT